MHSKLTTKITATIVGVVAMALLSTVAALLSTWHIGGLMRTSVTESLPRLRAAEELEFALLETRGLVLSSILAERDPNWLEDFEQKKLLFHDALDRAKESVLSSDEEKILDGLEEAYRRYDAKLMEMIALHQSGNKDEAISVFGNEVISLFQQVDGLLRDFVAENKRYIDSATARAQQRIDHVTWLVAGVAGSTFGLGLVLAWLFLHGVMLPLRKLVAEARSFSGQRSVNSSDMPEDELSAVGAYLHSLMCDVSDARSALEENRRRLINAEKLATVGRLAAGVAHEIRNPLTAVKMWLFSIRKAIGQDPKMDRKFEIISEEITRLERIVRNFLEFSRPSELKLEMQPISSLIDRTLELFNHRIEEKKLRLARVESEHLPLVMADADQFKQVLINLLDNAVEATSEDGEIQITTDTAGDRSMVVVRVRDSGQGMAQDVRERIFEPFYTTKEDGTGLGLCIAVQIMARHGGRLVLESSTEQGTAFAVWIPIAREASHEQNFGG